MELYSLESGRQRFLQAQSMALPGMTLLLLFVVIGVDGCAPESRYLELVAATSAMKADLKKVRAKRDALEQEVKRLEETVAKTTAEAEAVFMKQERLRRGRDEVREALERLSHVLARHLAELQDQHEKRRVRYRELQHKINRLKHMVALYQKALRKETQASHSAADIPVPSLPLLDH